MLSLLAEPKIESVVVGDVDQKIFGFSGVNPDLFAAVEKLNGAKRYPLQISQRCGTRICGVASLLSGSKAKVLPSETAIVGQTLLAKHADKPAELDLKLIERAFPSRATAKMRRCRRPGAQAGNKGEVPPDSCAKKGPSLSCRGVVQIVRAIDGLKRRTGRGAVDVAEAFVCRVLFADERPTEDEMRAAGVEPSVLRRLVRRLLLQVIDAKPGETWGQWAVRTKSLCAEIRQRAESPTTNRASGAPSSRTMGTNQTRFVQPMNRLTSCGLQTFMSKS